MPTHLSIVCIFHDMEREAKRTLYSLCSAYQSGVLGDEYEVVAIDNGSASPLEREFVTGLGPNFRYEYFQTNSASPVSAINYGAGIAKGENLAVIVDGARMVTPGIVRSSMDSLGTVSNPFVCTPAWHLGPKVQNESMLEGYDQVTEDQILDSIEWKSNGYRLFEISTIAQSSLPVLVGRMPNECSWFVMPRGLFFEVGGFDERFQAPGGGLVNQDFLLRITSRPEISPIVILNEGSFHQIHGGVATNVPLTNHPIRSFQAEYKSIHGEFYQHKDLPTPGFVGRIPSATLENRACYPIG